MNENFFCLRHEQIAIEEEQRNLPAESSQLDPGTGRGKA
jgi:hypothetical protein